MNSILLLIICSLPRTYMKCHEVDVLELNHSYSKSGEFRFDQVILWKWDTYYDEGPHRELKVVDWYLVTQYREQLTKEERHKKTLEFHKQLVKELGKGADVNAPPYTPKFHGGPLVPRYDHYGKYWFVLVFRNGVYHKIYGRSYKETSTAYDPEVRNRQYFPIESREDVLRNALSITEFMSKIPIP